MGLPRLPQSTLDLPYCESGPVGRVNSLPNGPKNRYNSHREAAVSVRVSPFKLRPVSMSYCRTRIVDMRSQCATIPGPRGAGLGPRKLCTVILRSVISSSVILGGVLCAIGLFSSPVSGQQVTTGVNNVGVGHSFNENFGVGFNAQFGGGNVVGFLNNPGGVQSPFGGFNPGAGANGGFQFGGNGFSGNLNFSLGQGSGTTLTSTSASVTTMNGQPGMISDQVQVPFVLGVTPIVNGRFYHPTYGMLPRPLTMPPAESPFVQRYRRLNGGGGPVAKPKNHAAPRRGRRL